MDLLDLFNEPSNEFRPIPFWFWNETRPEKFNKEAICEQIRQFHEKGLGGFVIFNKPAYCGTEKFGFSPDEYLSGKWFEFCRIAINQAKEFGMEAWINDDYNFPPGDLGGRMKVLLPEAYSRTLSYSTTDSLGSQCYLGKDVLSIVANPRGNKDFRKTVLLFDPVILNITPVIDISGEYEYITTSIQRVEGPEGHLNRFPCFLDPEVNAIFINEVYEKYKSEIGDLFGNGLTGFFADCDARRANHFPWARKFDERFFKAKGYSIVKLLPALWFDFEETSRQIRYDYYDFISKIYSEWFKKCHQWCQKNGVMYMYHTSDTGPLSITEGSDAYCKRSSYFLEGRFHQVNEHGDYAGTDHELMGLTGGLHFAMQFNGKIEDWEPKAVLWGTTDKRPDYKRLKLPNKTYGDIRAKYTSSLAHCRNKRGAMCEAFAATNWSATIGDLKWIADWQMVQGINRFVPHAFFFSLEGTRKHFAPPDHFHSHLWHDYKTFTTYIGRVCGILSMGNHVADIAVLDSAAGLWRELTYKAETIFNLFDILNHSCFDYDVISEEDIIGAAVIQQTLKIGNEAYKVLIVPPLTKFSHEMTEKLQEFIGSGGHVVCFDILPSLSNATQIEIKAYDHEQIFTDHDLVKALEEIMVPDVCFYDGDSKERIGYVHFLHRRTDNSDIYFVVNLEGDGKSSVFSMSMPRTNSPVMIWDPTTGDRCTQISRSCGERTEIDISLPFRSSKLIIIDHALSNPSLFSQCPHSTTTVKILSGWKIEALDSNMLSLTIWNNDKLEKNAVPNHLVQENDALSFHFELLSECKDISILIPDFISLNSIQINGKSFKKVLPIKHKTLFDAHYFVLDIAPFVKIGQNKIELLMGHFDQERFEYTPLYLSGNFSVEVGKCTGRKLPHRNWYHFTSERSENVEIKLDKTGDFVVGDWCKQGFPFYSGTVRYTAEFLADDLVRTKNVFLQLELMNCTAKVKMNGRLCGTVCWSPYCIELIGIQNDKNIIEIDVQNTWANILEEYPLESGLSDARLLIGDNP